VLHDFIGEEAEVEVEKTLKSLDKEDKDKEAEKTLKSFLTRPLPNFPIKPLDFPTEQPNIQNLLPPLSSQATRSYRGFPSPSPILVTVSHGWPHWC